jgi:hypothetical protein
MSPFFLEPDFVKPGRGQRLDAADRHKVLQIAPRQTTPVDLEDVGMERGLRHA